ncbi:UDP-2,4-diacetamido-2,4,6-trideoxy-beta-L-altropyranose hydrolase [Ulvibacterium sp.]|uniref:UDP-2,4-diacetamido-2,4, 6-trideoxy-beta-L-altropyranose hydrolase n=1 Tax=Ulvibacterium sp. TaxID=2665914 RepID=UPI003BACEF94
MIKKIIFRADGNSTIGLGHLYRLFSLAEIIKHEFDFVFLVKNSSTTSVIPKSYSTVIIPNAIQVEEEPEWIASHFSPKKYNIVIDGYQFLAPYQKLLKQRGYGLIYIDDLAKVHMHADVVINHSPYVKKEQYTKEKYTQLALGTNYALVRPLFLEAAKKKREIDKIDNAFVCFGGADPFNLTMKTAQAFLKIPRFKKVHIVLGGSYRNRDIFDLRQMHDDKIKVYKNLSEQHLLDTMQKCNFAIAPASTILYELCCIKMPILGGFYIENQELIYKGLVNKAAIYKGENMKNYQVSDFEDNIRTILTNGNHSKQIKAQKELFDEKIADRHLELIRKL